MEDLISVVIPTYNYAHYLARAVDSVARQHTGFDELIIVDDGSTDETSAVLAACLRRYPWIQVVRQANGGAASARNHGLRLANGRFVLFLDADDELLPDALRTLRAASAARPEAEVVLGGQITVYPDGAERMRLPEPIPTAVSDAERVARVKAYLLDRKIAISHSRSMFSRDLLVQRPYPEILRSREDIPVFAFLLAHADVATAFQPVARIHKHPDSLRHRNSDEERVVGHIVDEVFAQLPAACEPLRARYAAQQYLSLSRGALEYGDAAGARRYYLQAFRLSPRQALQWRYFRKIVRSLVGGK